MISCSQFELTEHSHFCFLIKNKMEKIKFIHIKESWLTLPVFVLFQSVLSESHDHLLVLQGPHCVSLVCAIPYTPFALPTTSVCFDHCSLCIELSATMSIYLYTTIKQLLYRSWTKRNGSWLDDKEFLPSLSR